MGVKQSHGGDNIPLLLFCSFEKVLKDKQNGSLIAGLFGFYIR